MWQGENHLGRAGARDRVSAVDALDAAEGAAAGVADGAAARMAQHAAAGLRGDALPAELRLQWRLRAKHPAVKLRRVSDMNAEACHHVGSVGQSLASNFIGQAVTVAEGSVLS